MDAEQAHFSTHVDTGHSNSTRSTTESRTRDGAETEGRRRVRTLRLLLLQTKAGKRRRWRVATATTNRATTTTGHRARMGTQNATSRSTGSTVRGVPNKQSQKFGLGPRETSGLRILIFYGGLTDATESRSQTNREP